MILQAMTSSLAYVFATYELHSAAIVSDADCKGVTLTKSLRIRRLGSVDQTRQVLREWHDDLGVDGSKPGALHGCYLSPS